MVPNCGAVTQLASSMFNACIALYLGQSYLQLAVGKINMFLLLVTFRTLQRSAKLLGL